MTFNLLGTDLFMPCLLVYLVENRNYFQRTPHLPRLIPQVGVHHHTTRGFDFSLDLAWWSLTTIQAESKIEITSGVVVHSYLGNQTRKTRRALEIVSIFDLGINKSVAKELSKDISARTKIRLDEKRKLCAPK